MPPENADPEDLPGADTDPAGDPPADDPVAVALAQAPADVRNSPEYRELAKVARRQARELGRSNSALAAARGQAEADRLAAEAQRQAALESTIADVLGEDGVDAFNELAELSSSNPVEAARRFKELMGSAQSAPPAEPPAAPPSDPEAIVDQASNAVPPPPGAVDGSAPLQPPNADDDLSSITDPLDKRYMDTVERNLTPSTRNRVTMRERADALIGYVGSAYLKTPEIAAKIRLRR